MTSNILAGQGIPASHTSSDTTAHRSPRLQHIDMLAFVVVSGLPAGGKTTLAAALAHHRRWPHLDQDAMLAALFSAQRHA